MRSLERKLKRKIHSEAIERRRGGVDKPLYTAAAGELLDILRECKRGELRNLPRICLSFRMYTQLEFDISLAHNGCWVYNGGSHKIFGCLNSARVDPCLSLLPESVSDSRTSITDPPHNHPLELTQELSNTPTSRPHPHTSDSSTLPTLHPILAHHTRHPIPYRPAPP